MTDSITSTESIENDSIQNSLTESDIDQPRLLGRIVTKNKNLQTINKMPRKTNIKKIQKHTTSDSDSDIVERAEQYYQNTNKIHESENDEHKNYFEKVRKISRKVHQNGKKIVTEKDIPNYSDNDDTELLHTDEDVTNTAAYGDFLKAFKKFDFANVADREENNEIDTEVSSEPIVQRHSRQREKQHDDYSGYASYLGKEFNDRMNKLPDNFVGEIPASYAHLLPNERGEVYNPNEMMQAMQPPQNNPMADMLGFGGQQLNNPHNQMMTQMNNQMPQQLVSQMNNQMPQQLVPQMNNQMHVQPAPQMMYPQMPSQMTAQVQPIPEIAQQPHFMAPPVHSVQQMSQPAPAMFGGSMSRNHVDGLKKYKIVKKTHDNFFF